MYHGLPDAIQGQFSITYPIDYECRELDAITRAAFDEYLETGFETALRDHRRNADLLKEALEPLGFDFQPFTDERVHFKVPATVPADVDRDALVHYIKASDHHLPVTITWANPWAKTYHAERFGEEFPNTRRAAERIICFEIRAMDRADVSTVAEKTKTYLGSFG